MQLLRFGAVALIAAALTFVAAVGPSNVSSRLSEASAPISSAIGQVPRVGAVTPGGPAVLPAAVQAQVPAASQAPATRQISTDTTVQVYQQWRPSVVTVINSVVQPGFRSEPQPQGTGSGFLIDNQGHILTNNHVVAEADKLEVTLSDGTTFPAKLIGRDSRFDLAVIQADIPANQLQPVKLGDSDQLQVGEQVIAIGNPYGLDGTVTTGIVSGRRAVVTEPDGDGLLVKAIQTDASINPGNSGGPLLNAQGEVIGVTTLGLMPNGGQAGLNFAIPINSAKQIIDTLMRQGTYPHPFVGIATAEITPSVAQDLQLPVQAGLLVQSVDPSSAAAQAGLKAGSQQQQAGTRQIAAGGDIITAVDGQPMKRPEEFISYLETNKKAGDPMTITILRNGQQQNVQLTLGQRPADTQQTTRQQPAQQPGQRQQPGRQQPGQQPGQQQPRSPFPIPVPGR